MHSKLHLDRRLNLLLYLNKDWREAFGGHLELWDAQLRSCKKILPTFNRTVIFSTNDTSFHGHPQPLASPPGITRKSVSVYYYYTAGRPTAERPVPHDTVFRDPGRS